MLGCTWTYPAVVDEIGTARRDVADYAAANAVPEPPLADLKLAVSEAVTNAVLHGFRSTDPGTVTVSVAVKLGTVSVCVADDGQGMSPRTDSPGIGLGLPLMAEMADRLAIDAAKGGHGTEVRMAFDFAIADEVPPAAA